jgi:hypothetical protein
MNGDRWRTVFSFGGDGTRRAAVMSAPSTRLPSISPPTNFYTSQTEQIHRATFPQPPAFDLGYVNPLWTPQLEQAESLPEPSESTTALPAGELPPVVEAPEPKVNADAQARKLLSAATEAIVGSDVSNDEGLQSRAADLLSELADLSARLGQFLADVRNTKVDALTIDHENAASRCREQREVLDRSVRAATQQVGIVRSLAQKTGEARALFTAIEARTPDVADWPTRADLAQWQREYDEAEKRFEAAQADESQARAELRRLQQKAFAEDAKLNGLADVELVLRKRLRGESYFDDETGLEHSPEL